MAEKPIDKIPFTEAKSLTIEELVDLAVNQGADRSSIEIFLKVLHESDCSVLDGWDTYLTD